MIVELPCGAMLATLFTSFNTATLQTRNFLQESVRLIATQNSESHLISELNYGSGCCIFEIHPLSDSPGTAAPGETEQRELTTLRLARDIYTSSVCNEI